MELRLQPGALAGEGTAKLERRREVTLFECNREALRGRRGKIFGGKDGGET